MGKGGKGKDGTREEAQEWERRGEGQWQQYGKWNYLFLWSYFPLPYLVLAEKNIHE